MGLEVGEVEGRVNADGGERSCIIHIWGKRGIVLYDLELDACQIHRAALELLLRKAYVGKKIDLPGLECVGVAFDIWSRGFVVFLAGVDYRGLIIKDSQPVSIKRKGGVTCLDNGSRPQERVLATQRREGEPSAAEKLLTDV